MDDPDSEIPNTLSVPLRPNSVSLSDFSLDNTKWDQPTESINEGPSLHSLSNLFLSPGGKRIFDAMVLLHL
jgi:hypothetical protein